MTSFPARDLAKRQDEKQRNGLFPVPAASQRTPSHVMVVKIQIFGWVLNIILFYFSYYDHDDKQLNVVWLPQKEFYYKRNIK